MNLGDPELELIDPTPNIYTLFVHFDKIFFWTKLAGRSLVRWSKRMYSCAGVCAYEGRNGVCDIALSEPLLKLRPRKDLVETLLHEMIHAFLFITNQDDNRDGHGPNFLAHMHRINKQAGLNISVYHDFHDEVKLYQTHWWRCNGVCQKVRPYFGIVRRSANRAPGPADFWWTAHQRHCGGTFVKIKEPDPKKPKKPVKSKPNADITKYITNNNNNAIKTNNVKSFNDIKDFIDKQNSPCNAGCKSNTKSIETPIKSVKPTFVGSGKPISSPTQGINRSNSNVIETVRNVWLNKKLGTVNTSINKELDKSKNITKRQSTDTIESTPKKTKKIDDYFKTTAPSILKDLYGKDFELVESKGGEKLKAVVLKSNLVDCPICNIKVESEKINSHIDECLNKDVIEKISKEDIPVILIDCENNLQKLVDTKPEIFGFKDKTEHVNKDDIGTLVNKIENKRKSVNIVPKVENEFVGDVKIKSEPGTSKEVDEQKCPCCGLVINKPIQEHLDECGVFFDSFSDIMSEGEPSSSISNQTTILIDDDDQFDETLTFNATGTKSPCPCCLQMVENTEMNVHLDTCLS